MRMIFKCKNCKKRFYLHDKDTRLLTDFMARFGVCTNVDKVINKKANCCDNHDIEMVVFIGFEE